MKIVTWNINSIRIRLPLLEELIVTENPDVICLQEIKVIGELFPIDFFKSLGYPFIYHSGQKSFHGVAIISRFKGEENFNLEFCNDDKRHICVKIQDIEIHNFYVPAGGDIPDAEINIKFKHKLEFINLMIEWFKINRTKNDNIILLGDLNIAPYKNDVWSSQQLKNVVSHTDIEREALLNLLNSLKFIDSCRFFVPYDVKYYTWWSYRNIDWQKSDRGRRLDHIWVSNNLSNRLSDIKILREARDWPSPSDHVPYIMTLLP